jgi:hypothetical protein
MLHLARYLGRGVQHPHVLPQAVQAVQWTDAGVKVRKLLVEFPFDMPPGVTPGIRFNEGGILWAMQRNPLRIKQIQSPFDYSDPVAVRQRQINQKCSALQLGVHTHR